MLTSEPMHSIRSKRKSRILLSIPTGTEMFHFPAYALSYKSDCSTAAGSPHSDISGSKVDWHLAETFRSHSTSFIALYNLGIHHTPLHSHRECCTPLYNFDPDCIGKIQSVSYVLRTYFWVLRWCLHQRVSAKVFIRKFRRTCVTCEIQTQVTVCCVVCQGRKDPMSGKATSIVLTRQTTSLLLNSAC